MEDAKALIAASGLRIIACDDLEEAAEMVRVLICIASSYCEMRLRLFFVKDKKLKFYLFSTVKQE